MAPSVVISAGAIVAAARIAATTLSERPSNSRSITYVLSGLAELALLEREIERAAELLGASQDLFRDIGVGIEQSEAKAQHRILSELYEVLGEERTDELRERGAARSVDELVVA